MQVTEVNIYPQPPRVRRDGEPDEHFLAFATVVLDDALRIDGLKVIRGNTDNLFVAMPTRRVEAPCPRCRVKNGLRYRYCRNCGTKLDPAGTMAALAGPEGKVRMDKCVVHPVHAACRAIIEDAVLEEYRDVEEAARRKPVAPLAGRLSLAGRA